MKGLLLSLALLAVPAVAQEPAKPTGAVVIEACGKFYGVAVVMSDGTYVILGREDMPSQEELTKFLESVKTTVAGIEDPTLCGVST